MVTLNAHFDGKVLVPDEPLVLEPNQKVRITIETIDAPPKTKVNLHSLLGMGGKLERPYDPAEEDALWEKGPLPPPSDSEKR